MTTTAKNKEKIRFSKAFWVANTVELFERAAYYRCIYRDHLLP